MLVYFAKNVLEVQNCLEKGFLFFSIYLSPSSCCDGLVLPTLLPELSFPRLVEVLIRLMVDSPEKTAAEVLR